MKNYKLLLLEDDQSFGYVLSEYLTMCDFEVTWTKSAEEALGIVQNSMFDLAILDIMLPKMNGYEFAEKLQSVVSDLPFIFLSAKSLKIDKLKGFKLGAFDYITKPIDEELLVVKIKALLNHTQIAVDEVTTYQIGKYEFSPNLFKLIFQKEDEIKLTARETKLLEMLCKHHNQLLPRKRALAEIWGTQDEFSRKSMDVFISHLRKYLSQDSSISIENIHGRGFIFKF